MAKRLKGDSSLPPRSLKNVSSEDQVGTEVVLANWFTASGVFSQWYSRLNQVIKDHDFDRELSFAESLQQDGHSVIDSILELHADVSEEIARIKEEIEACPGDIHSSEKQEILIRHTEFFMRWSSKIQRAIEKYTDTHD